MELSQKIRTQKTLQLRQILQMFFLFSLHWHVSHVVWSLHFNILWQYLLCQFQQHTKHLLMTNKLHQLLLLTNIARSNHDIEYAEVGENNSYIMEKEKHCEIAFILSKSDKKWKRVYIFPKWYYIFCAWTQTKCQFPLPRAHVIIKVYILQ